MLSFVHADDLRDGNGPPRYEQLAGAICKAIRSGQLKPGDRLPTVRRLASQLGVSLTTVTSAFKALSEDGWIRGEIGRGTFVSERLNSSPGNVRTSAVPQPNPRRWSSGKRSWRRRALTASAERLRSAYPGITDCSTGRPDPSLLPLKLIKRHWKNALDEVSNRDLQYRNADPVEALAAVLPKRFSQDHIPARAEDLVVANSAQQLMVLVPEIVIRLWGAREAVVAVEQPGYPTIFDTWDRAGVRMIGVETDEEGVRPESLAHAIEAGANAVLFTPRALNPTGASWTPQRMRALADVLSTHPHVLAIEDDHFGDISCEHSGSLLSDARIEDRVIYIRSFSKSIAPDLRMAVAAARPSVKGLLYEAKCHADGWSSRLLQRVLARILQDRDLDAHLSHARQTYRERRERAAAVLMNCGLPELSTWPGKDGVNLWIHLPPGLDATEVIERAAALGVLVAPGEPFYLSPGRSDVLRFNAGSVSNEGVAACAKALVNAIENSRRTQSGLIHV